MSTINPPNVRLPSVKVVEASAGSGKTYALARRYVQLLFDPVFVKEEEIPLRQILAMTFTNKAASEMKDRILEYIKKIALEKFSSGELHRFLSPVEIMPEKASPKAHTIMAQLIRSYNFFQIQTIDSFMNALLSGCAFTVGLSANFHIKRDYKDHLELSLDRLIDRACVDKDIRKLFEGFIDQYLFLENRTGWFPKKDILALVGSLFYQSNTLGYEFSDHATNHGKKILNLKRGLLGLMKRLFQNLPEATDKKFIHSLDVFLGERLSSLRSGKLIGFDVDRLSDYFLRAEFPMTRGTPIPKATEKLWHSIRQQLKGLCELEATSLLNCYIDVFKEVVKDFKKTASQEDVLFLEELNKTAHCLFAEETLKVEELYYRLATRFRHYLIDEFQDTSRLQWQNLLAMVEEALSTGGTLFYVGDKKQAIYGFRGGDIKLFDEIKKRFQDFGVVTEHLETNYRSHNAIVEFNNQIFSTENLKRFLNEKESFEQEKKRKNRVFLNTEEKEELLKIFAKSKQNYLPEKSQGFVQVELIEAENRESQHFIIKDKLIRLVRDLKERFSCREMAILARDNEEVEVVTSWLLAEGIGVESERTSNIRENFLIKELISFLRFLDSPIDNLHFASFILGDIFTSATGLDDRELHHFIFRFRKRILKEKELYLYKEFQRQYPQAWKDYLEEFFKNVGLFPLYELVISILHRFQCLQEFPEFQGLFMKFLEFIKNQEEETTDLASFLKILDEAKTEDLFVKISDTDTIQVLTIHKAKGLEFPVVIIPFLKLEIQIGQGIQGTKPYVAEVRDNRIELIHLKQKYTGFSSTLEKIYRDQYQKIMLSELNNIYVALTRAICELYAFVPARSGNQHNLARFLIPEDNLRRGEKSKYALESRCDKEILTLKPVPSGYRDWIDILKEEFQPMDLTSDYRKLIRGEMMHRVLSCIERVFKGKEEDAIQSALEVSAAQFPSLPKDEARTFLTEVLTNEKLRPFFIAQDGQVFQEKEIVDQNGHTKRLDRLIIKKDEVWIIDYKSHRELKKIYHDQVKDYMHLVKELYPDHTIRGFLIYLDELDYEELEPLNVPEDHAPIGRSVV